MQLLTASLIIEVRTKVNHVGAQSTCVGSTADSCNLAVGECGPRDSFFFLCQQACAALLLNAFGVVLFFLGMNFRAPQGKIKMQGEDGNGFSFVLIKLQWQCVVYLHSAEHDKSKVMQLSPRDSFLQAALRTAEGWKNISHVLST